MEKFAETESLRHQLIGDVSNQIHKPLSTIKDFMEGLLDGVIPPTPETFHHIYVEADQLQGLLNDIQDLSRIEASSYHLEQGPVTVFELVDIVIRQMHHRFEEKSIGLEIQQSPGLPRVFVDKNRVLQVLTNIVSNALKFTPAGGKVIIRADLNGQEVLVSVIDNGSGIAPERLPTIFNPLPSTDKTDAEGGKGLGLTIAQALVNAHGGKIWVESAGVSKGSAFHFTLPAYGLPVK